jgi:hypothetical protein
MEVNMSYVSQGFDFVSLSTSYEAWKGGLITIKDLETRIIIHVKKNMGLYNIQQRDCTNVNDFLSWVYPSLSSSITRYCEMGSSFSAYIQNIISNAYKGWNTKAIEHRLTEYIFWMTKATENFEFANTDEGYAGESYTAETESDYEGYNPENCLASVFNNQNTKHAIPNPKQILILTLKAYYFLQPDLIQKIAPYIGMDFDKINSLIDKIKIKRESKERELHNMRERLYSQYYRCLSFENRLKESFPGTMRRAKLTTTLARAKTRLSKIRKRLTIVRLDASNLEVAEVLGLTKGTVDSTLHNLRKNYGKLIS